jgi:hypothetical protein
MPPPRRGGQIAELGNCKKGKAMAPFMNWLRVELLRLRSFDWGSGSKSCHWLRDGVAKFNSFYSTISLAKKIGISEEEIITAIDSSSVTDEPEAKSFTLGWKGEIVVLSWLEEGISEWKTVINQDYSEEDGKFYVKFRLIRRIVYLDGTERVVSDTGEPQAASISEGAFMAALEQIRRTSDKPQ